MRRPYAAETEIEHIARLVCTIYGFEPDWNAAEQGLAAPSPSLAWEVFADEAKQIGEAFSKLGWVPPPRDI